MVPIRSPWVRPTRPIGPEGRSAGADDPGAHGVVDIVIDVGDQIGQPDDLRLEGRRGRDDRPETLGVGADPVDHLAGQVQPAAVALEPFDHAHALLDVGEPARQDRAQAFFAGVAERRVPQVMAERDRLGQVLVEPQRARHRPGDLRDLERVRQPGAVVVALRREEDLRLVLEAPERLGVEDPVAVALEIRAQRAGLLGQGAAPARGRRAARGCSTAFSISSVCSLMLTSPLVQIFTSS